MWNMLSFFSLIHELAKGNNSSRRWFTLNTFSKRSTMYCMSIYCMSTGDGELHFIPITDYCFFFLSCLLQYDVKWCFILLVFSKAKNKLLLGVVPTYLWCYVCRESSHCSYTCRYRELTQTRYAAPGPGSSYRDYLTTLEEFQSILKDHETVSVRICTRF